MFLVVVLTLVTLGMISGVDLDCQRVTAPNCSQLQLQHGISWHAHESSCELYHVCHSGQLLTLTCGQGQRYDAALQVCDLAFSVPCNRCQVAALRTDDCPEVPSCTGFEWGQTKPYPPDCTKYVFCDVLGNSVVEACPDGEHFSPELRWCTSPAEAACPDCGDVISSTVAPLPECPATPECRDFEFKARLPYPPDCTKYVRCKVLNEDAVLSCRPGKEFSVTTEQCEDAAVANCQKCSSDITTLEPFTATEEESVTSDTLLPCRTEDLD